MEKMPVCGCTSHFGTTWSVIFAPEDNVQSRLEGYGRLPESKYPGMPIIEYNKAKLSSVVASIEGPPDPDYPGRGGSLAVYLWNMRTLAIPVRRIK